MSIARAIRVAGRAAAIAGGTRLTIQRGAVATPCVPARRGRSEFQSLDSSQMVVTVRSHDFLIAVEDYDLGDGPVEPDRGDKLLLENADGTTSTYELLDLPGQPCWRWSDEHKQFLRVHTKEIPG